MRNMTTASGCRAFTSRNWRITGVSAELCGAGTARFVPRLWCDAQRVGGSARGDDESGLVCAAGCAARRVHGGLGVRAGVVARGHRDAREVVLGRRRARGTVERGVAQLARAVVR